MLKIAGHAKSPPCWRGDFAYSKRNNLIGPFGAPKLWILVEKLHKFLRSLRHTQARSVTRSGLVVRGQRQRAFLTVHSGHTMSGSRAVQI
jgi:hypothetical protein